MPEGIKVSKPIEVNLPVELPERPGDIELPPDKLPELSFFKLVKQANRMPKFVELPGAVKLRYYRKGEEVWRQGEIGYTAFYILTADDLAVTRDCCPGQARLLQAAETVLRAEQKVPAASVHFAAPRPIETSPTGFWERLTQRFRRALPSGTASSPVYIPFDGPVDVDYESLHANMYPGEIFGEAGCLDGLPRSATVIAERDSYLLEMTRNILDKVSKDDGYKAYQAQMYKERGLSLHLRKFSIFRNLKEEEFAVVLGHLRKYLEQQASPSKHQKKAAPAENEVSLVECTNEEVIFHENDQSDCVYLIRGGLVQVVKGVSPLLGNDDVRQWWRLGDDLVEGEKAEAKSPAGKIWRRLPTQLQESLRGKTPGEEIKPELRRVILAALNEYVIKDANYYEETTFQELAQRADLLKALPKNPKPWEMAWVNRKLLEALWPGVLRPAAKKDDSSLILSYRTRGDVIGEMGVVLDEPRSASCIAHIHPDSKFGKVELLRIQARVIHSLLQHDSPLSRSLKEIIAIRKQHTAEALEAARQGTTVETLTTTFTELGLAQGRKLMLIDLDRCTRCNECVQACVHTHTDGRSRLFLDGPRFEQEVGDRSRHFLVPTTCRSCLDPVCMTGCPVDSIHRGPKGQMVIESWCIGCNACAWRCPYGSIQMHDNGLIPAHANGWRYLPATLVSGDWWKEDCHLRDWAVGSTPFRFDRLLAEGLAGRGEPDAGGLLLRKDQAIIFHYTFALPPGVPRRGHVLQLAIAVGAATPEIYLNGEKTEWNFFPDGKRRGHCSPPGEPGRLRAGSNLLAIRVPPPDGKWQAGKDVLAARLDEVWQPGTDEQHFGTVVSQKAVVCDLCAALPQGPACVRACPHEATIRFAAQNGIPPW